MIDVSDVLTHGEEKMKKAIATLNKEFLTIRTGRANPAILDRVEVEYYGSMTPLKGVANISTADGKTLVIQPFDKTLLKEIEQAIHKSQLGLTPNNDGSILRINIPQLTEDRRKELAKQVKKYGEEAKIAIRNVRRDSSDELKKKLKAAQSSEDEVKHQEENLQKLTDKYTKEIDKHVQAKEADIMSI